MLPREGEILTNNQVATIKGRNTLHFKRVLWPTLWGVNEGFPAEGKSKLRSEG